MDPIQSIFHEKQEGSLCAQHCLNALLQGQYFTAVELADIARQLDEREREHMAEGGVQTDDYQRFIQQPSSNFDDSGFFSVQVIANALTVWNLELLPFNSRNDVSTRAREDPTQEAAFICNFREHWFSVRKLGHQWFNLNSLLSGPELISDTYLAMFLTQLQQEGYALFLVIGELPGCDADEILKVIPAEQPVKPSLITDKAGTSSTQTGETTAGADDEALQRALAESRDLVERDDKVLQRMLEMSRAEDEGRLLEQALQMSMEGADSASMPSVANRLSPDGSETASTSTASLTPEELRNKRLAYLGQPQGSGGGGSGGGGSTDKPPGPNTNNSSSTQSTTDKDEKTEADLLQEAIQLSMEQP